MGSITTIGGSEKIGDVKMHAANAVPPGWLVCNGALVSRVAYGALFAAIGVVYGAGDGVSTFALPDMRGEFPRGFDGGRGVDAGRVFGSAASDTTRSHAHALQAYGEPAGGGAAGDYAKGVPTIDTTIFIWPSNRGNGVPGWQNVSGVGISSTVGGETSPRNVAMLFCIKYAG